jgi:hypothetical protein
MKAVVDGTSGRHLAGVNVRVLRSKDIHVIRVGPETDCLISIITAATKSRLAGIYLTIGR